MSVKCPRCGSVMEWRTREFQPGGEDFCWSCDARAKRGLPALPLKPVVPLELIRKEVQAEWSIDLAKYAALTVGIEDAKREDRRRRQAIASARHREKEARALSAERQAARQRQIERRRPYWQKRAEQLGLMFAPDLVRRGA